MSPFKEINSCCFLLRSNLFLKRKRTRWSEDVFVSPWNRLSAEIHAVNTCTLHVTVYLRKGSPVMTICCKLIFSILEMVCFPALMAVFTKCLAAAAHMFTYTRGELCLAAVEQTQQRAENVWLASWFSLLRDTGPFITWHGRTAKIKTLTILDWLFCVSTKQPLTLSAQYVTPGHCCLCETKSQG